MFGKGKFDHLLSPGFIGKVKTRNRIIKTAAGTRYTHHEDLHLSDMARAYYEALAVGGVGFQDICTVKSARSTRIVLLAAPFARFAGTPGLAGSA